VEISPPCPLVSFTFDDFPRSALKIAGALLESYGAAGTYYVSLGLMGRTAPTGEICLLKDVEQVLERGHELACHTFDHCDAWQTKPSVFEESILRNRETLARLVPGVVFRTLAYPISSPHPANKLTAARHFDCCRGGGQMFNSLQADLNNLRAFFLEKSRDEPELIERMVDRNVEAGGWLIFATHDVGERPTHFGCPTRLFERIVRYVASSGATILPLHRAWTTIQMGASAILLSALTTILISASGFGQIIPDDRRIAWSSNIAGVPGDIPNRTTIFADVTKPPYNADNTGATDASTGIQNALNSCPVNQVVYMPSGNYRIEHPIDLGVTYYKGGNGKILRGAGSKTVLLDYTTTTPAAMISVGTDTTWAPPLSTPVTGALNKGGKRFTVANASSLAVGQLVFIDQENDPNLVWPASNNGMPGGVTTRLLRQTTRITAINGNQLAIEPASYWNWNPRLDPKVNSLGQVNGSGNWKAQWCGLEHFRIDRTHGTAIRSVLFAECFACWMLDVTSQMAPAYHFYVQDSLQCTITQCTARDSKHHGPNGSGIIFYERVSSCLIQDNIICRCYPGVEIDSGSGGNIIAYNYVRDNYTDSGLMGASFDCNHGAHTCMDLYEGNVGSMFQADGYYGSCSDITAFRNYWHGTNEEGLTQDSKCVDICRWGLRLNVVGNVLGTPGVSKVYIARTPDYPYAESVIYRLGYPNMTNNHYTSGLHAPPSEDYAHALDGRVYSSLILHGNYDYVNNTTVWDSNVKEHTLPASLYLTSKPSWFGNLAWPPIGPDCRPMTGLIPAQARFNGISYGSGHASSDTAGKRFQSIEPFHVR
jgi:peptidoglycan/xylan/chitin deacetylase (PgdA/CDA1 family)